MSDATREPEFVSVLRAMGDDDLCDTCGLLIFDSEGTIGADKIVSHITTLTQRVEAAEAERENVSSQLWDCMNEREGLKHKLATVTAERDEYVKRASVTQKMVYDLHRAERILDALREPSDAVVEEAASKMHDASEPDGDCRIAWEDCIPWYHITRRKMATAAIRAAVAAAEKEVGA